MAFPDVRRLTTATPFFCSRLLAANHPTTPHVPIPSIECHNIPSVVFRVCHPRPHSTDFCRSPLSLFGIHRFRRCLFFGIRLSGHYCPISFLFQLSHPPQPAAPSDINNTPPRRAAHLSEGQTSPIPAVCFSWRPRGSPFVRTSAVIFAAAILAVTMSTEGRST